MRGSRGLLVCLGLLGTSAAGALLPGVGSTLLALTAPALALLVPGLVLWPVLERLGWLPGEPAHRLVVTAMVSVSAHLLGHAAVLTAGLTADYWPMWAAALLLTLAAGALAARVGRPVPVLPSASAADRATLLVGAALLLLGVLVTSPPRFVGEPDTIPEQIFDFVYRFDHSIPERLPEITHGEGFRPAGDGAHEMTGPVAVLHVRMPVDGTLQLRGIIRNGWRAPLAVSLAVDGQTVAKRNILGYLSEMAERREDLGEAVYVPGPYVASRDPRNTDPALVILAPRLSLAAGAHRVELRVRPVDRDEEPGPRATWVDLTLLDPNAIYRRIGQHFFIGDLGDIRETIDFAEGFRNHVLQHTSSFAGDTFDGGGPTSMSDEPPGHHFLCYLVGTFRPGSPTITSASVLYLAELVLLWALCLHIARRGNPSFRPHHALPLLGLLLAYSRLCRLGLESNAPDTLFLLLVLSAALALHDGRRGLVLLLSGAAIYVHVPAPQALLLAGVAMALARRSRRPLHLAAGGIAVMGGVLLGRLGTLWAAVGWERALLSGQAVFLGANRLERLQNLLSGQIDLLPRVLAGAGELWLAATAASGGALLWALASFRFSRHPEPDDGLERGFIALGVLYAAALGLADAQRAHHMGPIVVPLAVAAVRRVALLRDPRPRAALWLIALAGGAFAVGYLLLASPDPTRTAGFFFFKYYIY